MDNINNVQLGGGNSFKINSLAKQAISAFFAVIFFFALGALVDSREAWGKACPPGTTPFLLNFSYNGCDYIADFCYQCPPTHMSTVTLRGIETAIIDTNSPCGIIDTNVIKAAQDAIFDELTLNLCVVDTCTFPFGYPNVTLTRPACWQVEHWPNLPDKHKYRWANCGESKCVVNFHMCVEYKNGVAYLSKFKHSYYLDGDNVDDCEDEPIYLKIGLPMPGFTFQDFWITPCFTKDRDDPCHFNP